MDDPRLRLAEIAADVAKAGLSAYVKSRSERHEQPETPAKVTVVEVHPSEQGCPYCTVAKHLAGAHLYLTRMQANKAYTSIYTELTRQLLDDALLSLYRLDQTPENKDMSNQMEHLSTKLNMTLSDEQLDMVTRLLWTLANQALNRAEVTRL